MQELSELHLGSSSEKVNDRSNFYTVDGFKIVLKALKQM
jgi:hypothetical protein